VGTRLSRRLVLAATASAFLWPAAAPAETAKMLRVGYVGMQPADAPIYDAFRERMAELGYRAGANFAFEYLRSPNVEAYPETYAALVALKPDIVLTAGSEPALRAAQASAGGLPIVLLAIDFDPLARGYVASLAHPGGNITGIFVPQLELARKRIELARELLPQATGIGILWDASSRDQAMAAGEAARAMGFEPRLIEVTDQPPDYAAAFARMPDAGGEPVVVPASPVFLRDRAEIEKVAREHGVPMIAAFRENADAGAVMSYGIDLADLFRDIADVVDHVAKGKKPAELPIAPPSHFHLALNLKSAAALGVPVPQTLLAIADEVME
jgi:putative tryptophan/tyrosine transport system substrate-binding protein